MSKFIILFVSVCLVSACFGARVTPAPLTCKSNEEYLPQGKAPNCDTVCSELGENCTKVYFMAPSGCYCIAGYARDANLVCIPIAQCPPKTKQARVKREDSKICRRNEIWMDDGKDCDTVCSELGEPCYNTWFIKPSGCYCADEFARDDNYTCIPIKDCPPKKSEDSVDNPSE